MRDAVLLNAAAALVALADVTGSAADDLDEAMTDALVVAAASIDSGAAAASLQRWVDASSAVSAEGSGRPAG